MRYSPEQHQTFAATVIREGFCVLPRHLPAQTLTAWNEQFAPLLTEHIQREGRLKNRGEGRYYVTLPFTAPWADEAVFMDPDVLEIVERLVGSDPVLCQLATDTPLLGSQYQEIHRDAPPLFPELPFETPPFQLAVNFSLVEVTLENGPVEIARGTHLMHREEGLTRLERGDVRVEPVLLELGDVMIRDVRGLHRGTPNRTETPRPMVVVGYSRKWLFRPEVSIQVPDATWNRLSERARRLLRFNPRVANLETAPSTEVYQSYAY
jgi:ectoine hydroxylase-related dioxygenase (phytanoyl-CoA dioxygenase family)